MATQFIDLISAQLSIQHRQVENTVALLEEGATIPFISRYRKERTGSLDEVQIGDIHLLLQKLQEVARRKQTILKTIDEQGNLTEELRQQIENTWSLPELEDLYLPYKPKRKTRASAARQKGLEPLAKIIMAQHERDIEARARQFITDEVADEQEALQGARDIIAEWINESPAARNKVRWLFSKKGTLQAKVVKAKAEEAIKYKDYFNYEESQWRAPSHRILAIRRGEDEGYLRVSIAPPEEEALEQLGRIFIKRGSSEATASQLELAMKDSYKRLLQPGIETEFRSSLKERADEEAIRIFAENLRQLLLAAPLGQKRVMALDPGYRTGCKLVCLDEQGNLIHNETIYPHPPQQEKTAAIKKLHTLANQFKTEAIAIGNGTASRETEHLVKQVRFERDVQAYVVSEAGASVYSASPVAREEFPNYDVTVRGAVSIGRRLMDPLAELVKIDAKSIGVGQYQHDVDQAKLKQGLDKVVESAVNSVGVNLNTASKHLLTYVSGLGPALAQNIVDYRSENGAFGSRQELKKVPRLGGKAFEQAAGFLRIPDAKNPLDKTAVHPESYAVVQQMAKDLKAKPEELVGDKDIRSKVDLQRYVTEETGLPTLSDILDELARPGRDPRKRAETFEFAKGITKIDDLEEGMILPGLVTNITAFGAFVDVGVKQDGLVHISNLKNEFVSNPADVVKLNQQVQVKVLEVDAARKRIQLSMKDV
ncbi:MAG: Tex family protein [Bacteroidia bacterium]